jgi:hypothetical protein
MSNQTNIETFEISNEESRRLRDEIDSVREFNDGRDCAPEILGQIVAQKLSSSNSLSGFKRALVVPALRVENLPIFRDKQTTSILSATMGYLGRLGLPFQWIEQSNEIFMSITPREGAALQSNASADKFDIHSDDGIIPRYLRPEILTLVGLSNDALAQTGVVAAQSIAEALPLKLAETAAMKRFSIKAPASFRLDGFTVKNVPILEPHRLGFGIRFPSYATSATDQNDFEAGATVHAVRAIAEEKISWTLIEPGTALLVNNFLSCHARSPIVGHRLLVRSYWGQGVWKLRQAQPRSRDIFSVRKLLGIDASGLRVAA